MDDQRTVDKMNSMRSLNDHASLDEILQQSFERPILLFKHSMTCGTSHAAREELFNFLLSGPSGMDAAMIVVQNARQISDRISDLLGVTHQSPQALFVRNGRAVWHKSHHAITRDSLQSAFLSATDSTEPVM